MDELKKTAESRLTGQSALKNRMAADDDLVNLEALFKKIPDVNGKKIPNSVYITLNDPAVFAWRVETALNSAIEQIEARTEDKNLDTDYIEDFLRAAFREADNLLVRKDLFPFDPFVDQMNCRRGRSAARCHFSIKKNTDELIPDILPMDTFPDNFACWTGKDGYAGFVYKTWRSKDQITDVYPKATPDTDNDIEVLDIWDPKTNEIWIDGTREKVQANPHKAVPLAFRKVPMGDMGARKKSKAHHGESIFFLMRDLLPELYRLVSINQSLNLKELDHALQLKIPNKDIVPGMKVESHDKLTAPDAVNVAPSEGGYALMPFGELKAQAQILHEIIENRIQRAGLNNFETGTFKQPMSAVALMQVAEGQDLVILPRLATRGFLKQDLATMAIRQTIAAAERKGLNEVTMGSRTWEIARLKGEYEIIIKYHFNDPKLDAARTAMAATQRGLIADHAIRRETLLREDPEGDERLLRWEEAERISPLVKMERTIRSLIEEAERGRPGADDEAIMLLLQFVPAFQKALAGEMTPEVQPELKPAQPIMPLFAGNGGM